MTTTFMKKTYDALVATKLAPATATNYLRTLVALNGGHVFKSLAFLRGKATILERLGAYAPSTQSSMLAGVVAVLDPYKTRTTFRPLFAYYKGKLGEAMTANKARTATHEPTATQAENWIDWPDVKKKDDELVAEVKAFAGPLLKAKEYETLLQMIVLSLYTELEPRRNQDYGEMFIVKKWADSLPKDKNYLDLAEHRFIFNKYKTAKKYGPQTLAIPAGLWDKITLYLKFHPLWKGQNKNAKNIAVPFIVSQAGNQMNAVNSITRILNRTFGKKIGASMLRHSFLSEKNKNIDVKDIEATATAMGHSAGMALEYVKKIQQSESHHEP